MVVGERSILKWPGLNGSRSDGSSERVYKGQELSWASIVRKLDWHFFLRMVLTLYTLVSHRSSTTSRWIALVTMQTNTFTYPFTGATIFPVFLIKMEPTESTLTFTKAGALSHLATGRSPMNWLVHGGLCLKHRMQFRVTLRTAEWAPRI